jgi:hypothetical protein
VNFEQARRLFPILAAIHASKISMRKPCQIFRAYASDDAIKVDFMIKVKERAIGMGNRSRA